MKTRFRKAGVIGAGVMGSAIAAHLANAGIEVCLLDIIPPEISKQDEKMGLSRDSKDFRNRLAEKGLDRSLKSRPASFYLQENAELITIGNMEDNLEWLKHTDLIIEAVSERLEIKQDVFEKIEQILSPFTIITSNTSGISAKDMCKGRSEDFRRHFAITHFFNPPRYMKLLEIVPGPDTLSDVIETLVDVCERHLGKGVVLAHDTPNFIANRIGAFSFFYAVRAMESLGLSIEAIDHLTGPVIGRPRSASFRTVDLVGLDILAHVADNVYNRALDDEKRDMFKVPDIINRMIVNNLLGEKTNKGFYKKDTDKEGNRIILSLDYNTFEYTPQEKVSFASFDSAMAASDLSQRIKILFYAKDIAGEFTFRSITETLIYSANRIPEITDNIINLDNAMKWGFGWKVGPFETWDELGLVKSSEKMRDAGYELPSWIKDMLKSGKDSFYKKDAGKLFYYDQKTGEYQEVLVETGIILLPDLKDRQKLVTGNKGASLIDIGDGVACLEFHTKMNLMGFDIINMVTKSIDIVKKDFDGMVIANHGTNFSAGANLALVLFTAQEEDWDELEWMVKTFQDSFMKLKYMEKPVVAAPAGMTLGGGCEICLAADRVRYAAETYLGLVEVGVGLVPAGGGTKELLVRNTEHLFEVHKGGVYPKQIELMPFLSRVFENIALAKVSTSGPEAVKLGYLRQTDRMTVNRDYLIDEAKKTIMAINLEAYSPPRPLNKIRVAGQNSLAMMKMAIWTLHEQGYATDHDVTVAGKVAHIICGGNVQEYTEVSEQYILDLEREAFLSLCGEPKTHARIQHMLKTGKSLRN